MRDRRGKFVELAEARVNRAIKDLQFIGNLSNRSAYEYTEADVRRVFRALQKKLDTARNRFDGRSGRDRSAFRLGED